jgi:hypothetical protein
MVPWIKHWGGTCPPGPHGGCAYAYARWWIVPTQVLFEIQRRFFLVPFPRLLVSLKFGVSVKRLKERNSASVMRACDTIIMTLEIPPSPLERQVDKLLLITSTLLNGAKHRGSPNSLNMTSITVITQFKS